MKRRYVCLPEEAVTQGGYSLITVQDEHIEAIRQWRNAQIDVLRQATPISPEQQVAYYAQHIWPALLVPQPANILLAFLHGSRLIGYGGLVHLAWEHRRGEVSFLLDTALAADTTRYAALFEIYLGLLKQLAFDKLRLHRLCTETYAFRDGTIAVLEHSGFLLEGRLRDHVRVDGQWVDALMHGCLRDPD
jgi:RimJ/RimL family protein N-acetyltransferase